MHLARNGMKMRTALRAERKNAARRMKTRTKPMIV